MKKTLTILLLAGSTLFGGCGDSREQFVFSGNNVTASTPVARDDAYATTQNVAVAIPAVQGVLNNDTLNAGPNSNITVTFPTTTTQGGTVTATNNFGAFTYTPAAGYVGTDSFTYTLSNGFSSATATVNLAVDTPAVIQGYFVDSVNGSDTNGSFQTGTPFQTIGAAVNAAGTNQDVIVRPGTYSGTIQLLNGQRLLGSGSNLIPSQAEAKPLLNGRIILADRNTVNFFRIEGSQGDAIDGDDQNGGTVTDCDIANTTNLGIAVGGESVTGIWEISDNTITNPSGAGIVFETGTEDDARIRINRNDITGSPSAAVGVRSSSNSTLAVQMNNNTFIGNSVGQTVLIVADGTSNACFEIFGNQNDDVYLLNRTSVAATFQVEQFNIIETLNTGDFQTSVGSQPPTSVPQGFCAFPTIPTN